MGSYLGFAKMLVDSGKFGLPQMAVKPWFGSVSPVSGDKKKVRTKKNLIMLTVCKNSF